MTRTHMSRHKNQPIKRSSRDRCMRKRRRRGGRPWVPMANGAQGERRKKREEGGRERGRGVSMLYSKACGIILCANNAWILLVLHKLSLSVSLPSVLCFCFALCPASDSDGFCVWDRNIPIFSPCLWLAKPKLPACLAIYGLAFLCVCVCRKEVHAAGRWGRRDAIGRLAAVWAREGEA